MGRIIINLPRLGETMEEARVTTWIVAPNTAFKRGDILLEVETDKTVVEVPALQDGVMIAHLVSEGDVVALEAPVAEIETAYVYRPVAAAIKAQTEIVAPVQMLAAQDAPQVHTIPTYGIAASPAARAVGRQLGVALSGVSGTGRNGRISAHDVRGSNFSDNKPTVVLLHGLFDNHLGWRDLPKRLKQAGFEVANLDLPGHGNALPPAQNFDHAVKIITSHIHESLSGQNLVIVGHSLGAALGASVATELQKQNTNSVQGLLMLAPAGLGMRINADFMDGMLTAVSRSALKNCFSFLGAGPMSDSSLDAELNRLLTQRPMVNSLAQSVAQNGFQQIDIAPVIAGLKVPVTAVFGLKDEIIDWHNCANLSQETTVHLMREAGHLPYVTSPEFICGLIANFNAVTAQKAQAA